MPDDNQERRFGDANSFQEAFESLESVDVARRREFVHDRLMSSIDQLCKKHLHDNCPPFNLAQIEVIKGVVYSVIFVLDPKNRKPKGFWKACWLEFNQKSPMGKVGVVFATGAGAAALIGGLFSAYDTARSRWWADPKPAAVSQTPSVSSGVQQAAPGGAPPPAPPLIINMERSGNTPPR